MKIEGVGLQPELPELSGSKTKTGPAGSFGETLTDAINKVVETQKQAETEVQKLAQGEGTDVHTAMLAMQKADTSFQMMMQVRNKLITAYEEIMRMQV